MTPTMNMRLPLLMARWPQVRPEVDRGRSYGQQREAGRDQGAGPNK